MGKFKPIYQLSFYLITLITFVFGGAIQFLFGISNTVLTFLIVIYCFLVYLLYAILKRRIVLNWVVLFAIAYVFLIFFTATVRHSNVIAALIYLIFPLLPLAVYLFGFVNYKEGYISFRKIFAIFYYIALLQLPILLIQKNFYHLLIGFNNSNQKIEWFDFMFGTFFLKSDHSLGIFILMIIAIILFKNDKVNNVAKWPKISILYLSITLFMTESNISKLFFVVLISASILGPMYQKHKNSLRFKIGAFLFVAALAMTGYLIKDQKFIQKRLGGTFEKQISLKNAEKFYKDGTAKRFQIVMVAASTIKTKWIGDGPYSYFDIRSGKFKKTQHFSQLIWTYYDLGLLGIFVVLCYIICLVGHLDLDKGLPSLFFLGIFLIYSFYTTILSDISIIFGIFSVFNRRN